VKKIKKGGKPRAQFKFLKWGIPLNHFPNIFFWKAEGEPIFFSMDFNQEDIKPLKSLKVE
jgi:hypothetical protein